MYNVLEKLRSGEPLTTKEKTIHEQGLVSVLKQIYADLDHAVATAYGWPADLDEQNILQRLVDLNHQRAAEEAEGHIRYLRPDYQNPEGPQATQEEFVTTEAIKGTQPSPPATAGHAKAKTPPTANSQPLTKQAWPKNLPEQLKAIRSILATHPQPLTETQIAKHFTRAPKKKIAELMEVLEDLG